MFDVAVIGAGPAGMSAAVYALRAGLSAAVFEGESCGGQMVYTPSVENYPGVAETSGVALAGEMQAQMTALGAELVERAVTAVREENGFVLTCGKKEYAAKTLIIANGAVRRKLGVPGEAQFVGRGVSYCAVCDGMFFRGKTVCVVGGGNTALEDALYLAGICEKVYLIHRRDSFRAQATFVEKVKASENIECIYSAEVVKILGENKVNAVEVRTASGLQKLDVAAVFAAVGLIPQNEMFRDLVALDENGYIRAGEDTRTTHPAIFAAGDTRTKTLRQIVTAAADGAAAATAAKQYLEG